MRIGSIIVACLLVLSAGCGESLEHKLEQAKISLSSGRPDAALTFAQAVLAERPDDTVAMLLVAKAQLRLRNYEESRKLLDRLATIEPAATEPRYELLNLALAQMSDLLSASEFTTNPELDAKFTSAKTLGHEQADWFGATAKQPGTSEYARARLILLDSNRIERLLREQEDKLRGAQGLVDTTAQVSTAGIEEQRREVRSMHLAVERHLEATLEADPTNYGAAGVLSRLQRKREGFQELWVLAGKFQDRTDLPPGLAAELVGEIINMPDRLYPTATRLEMARKLLTAVSEQGRNSAQWKNIRARLHLRDGEKEAAMALAQEVFRIQPKDVESRLTYAWCLFDAEQYSQAKTLLEAVAVDHRTHEQIQLIYGLTLAKLGERTLAVEALRRVNDRNPNNHLARAALVKLLSENRDTVSAVTEDINKLYQANPSDPDAIRFKLIAEISAGNKANIKSLVEAVEAIANKKPGHLRALVDGHIQLQNLDKALAYATQAVAMEPEQQEAYLLLTRVHMLRRDVPSAQKTLAQVREKFPGSLTINELLGQIYLSQGSYDRAIEMAQAMIAEKADHIEARLMLAHAYGQLAMTEEALDQVNEITQRHPNEPRALEMAASIHRMAGQPELAKAYLEKIDESTIDEAKHPAVLAQLKLQKGEVDEARAVCERAIAAGSLDPRLRLTLSHILKVTRNSGEEEVHLTAFVRDNPMNFHGYQLLTRFYVENNPERGVIKFNELRRQNEVFARIAESTLHRTLGRSNEAVIVLMEIYPQLVQRRDPVVWTYTRILAAALMQRDRSVDSAVSVFDALVKSDILPARAMLAQAELLWSTLDDAGRVARLKEIEPQLKVTDSLAINGLAMRFAQAKAPDLGIALLERWGKDRPQDASMRTLRGDLQQNAGRLPQAIEAYREAIALEPDVPGRYVKLADAQRRAGLFPAAEITIDEMTRLDGGSRITGLWYKANMFIGLGLHDAAATTLDEIRKAGQANDPRVMLALGQVMISLNRLDEARSTLLNVPTHADEYGNAQVLVARVERSNPATVDAAKSRLEKLASTPGAAQAAARELLKLAGQTGDYDQLLEWADQAMSVPNLPPALRVQWLLVRANIKSRQRDWEAVDRVASELIAMDGKYPDYQVAKVLMHLVLKRNDEASKLFASNDDLLKSPNGLLIGANLGIVKAAPTGSHPFIAYLIAMANGNYDAAASVAQTFPNFTPSLYRQDLIDEALRAKEQSVPVETYRQLALAATAQQVGLPQLSDVICQDIIKTQPACTVAHAIRLASLTRQQTKVEPALAAITASVPQSSLGLYVAVSRHQEASEWEPAIAAGEKLVAREPDHDRAALHLVQLYDKAKSIDKAMAILDRIYKKAGPTQVVAGNDLAYLLMDHHPDRLKEAREIALNVSKLAPNSAAIQDTVGWIEHLSGNHEQALIHLARAASGNAESSEWHYHIGKVYSELGNKIWARRHMLIAKNGKGPVAEKASQYLAQGDTAGE